MRISIEMPTIDACDATGCAYNANHECHARAITVGDGIHPACDTYIPAGDHVDRSEPAGVGACKVSGCRHNRNLECEATAIRVAPHREHADCMTYEPREAADASARQ
jgi:hypothetical protein